MVLSTIEDVDFNELTENINKIDDTIQSINSKITKYESELNDIRIWNAEVNEQIKTQNQIKLNNQKVKSQIESIQKSLNDAELEIQKLSTFISNFKDPSTFLKQAQETIKNYQQDINDKQELIKDFEFTYRKLVEDLLEDLTKKYDELKEQLQPIETEHLELIKVINQEKPDTECSKCKRPYDVQDIIETFELNKKNAEERASLLVSKEIAPRRELMSDLKQQIKDVKSGNFIEGKDILQELNDAESELEELKEFLKKANELFSKKIEQQRQYDISKEKHSNLLSKIKEYKEQLEFLNNQIMIIPEITLELKDENIVKIRLNKQKENYNQALTISVELKDTLKKAELNKDKKNKLTESLNKYKNELQLLEILCTALGKSGIPANIIESILPEIVLDANMYLSKMSDKVFELEFNTTNTLKNGEERGTLDVSVFDGFVWRNFESLSGGEQFKVSLSIRLALSKVLSRRAGIQLDLLILDEASSALDKGSQDLFVSVIKSLSKSFSRIIIMSHIESLAGEFDSRINLDKSEEGTKVLCGTN